MFKHVKSFLKLRPFFVNTNEHVAAACTVCVLAYLLNQALATRQQRIEGEHYLNTKKLDSPLQPCRLAQLRVDNSGHVVKKLVRRTSEQCRLLRELAMSHLETPTWLKDCPKTVCSHRKGSATVTEQGLANGLAEVGVVPNLHEFLASWATDTVLANVRCL